MSTELQQCKANQPCLPLGAYATTGISKNDSEMLAGRKPADYYLSHESGTDWEALEGGRDFDCVGHAQA